MKNPDSNCRRPRLPGAWLLFQLLLLLMLSCAAQAQFTYTTSGSQITITGYNGTGGAVTIPSTINGLPVTSIGDNAFSDCTSLTSVTIPSGVTSIGVSAFGDCYDLTSVTIPSGVTSIGDEAFGDCYRLTGVTIPNSVTSIGVYAFGACSSLTSVTIPNSVTSIGDDAFSACSSLASITVSASNSFYSSAGGVLFNSNTTTLIQYPEGMRGGYTIPNSVTSIGDDAFGACTGLTSVTIPNGVTSIGDYAFEGCTGLTSVTIPNGVTSIGDYAFEVCKSLTSVTIPNGVTSIGDYAFYDCTSLTSVTIPDSVTSIGDYAFYDCTSLTSVTIPDSVTSIGDYAFCGTSLTSVTIPDSVTSIGDYAFYDYTSLTSALFLGNAPSMGDSVFAIRPSYFTVGYVNGVAGFTSPTWNGYTAVMVSGPIATTGNATGITYQRGTLNGTINPDGLATTLYFQYGPTTAYGNITATQSAGSGTSAAPFSAAITDLCAGTTYHYQIVAANAIGTTYGLDQTFTTANPPPSVATGSATETGYNAATLNGTVDANGLATTYYFRYGTTASYGSTTASQSAGSGTTTTSFSAAITGLTSITTYHYQIVAINSSGTSYGLERTFTTTNPPPSVSTAMATGVVYNAATLNGTINPNGLATTLYFQYGTTVGYGTTTDTQNAASGTTALPFSAAVSGLSAATTYHYQLVAVNSSGTSCGGDQTFTTANPPPTVITEPATGIAATSGILNGTVNPNGFATSIYFQSGTSNSYGNATAIRPAGSGTMPTAFSVNITGLSPATVYHFCLVATSTNGTTYGDDQWFTTANAAPVVTTETATGVSYQGVTLSGTVVPNGPTTICFQYGKTKAYGSATMQVTGSGASAMPLLFNVTGLEGATRYHYRCVATNSVETVYGQDQTFTTADPPPTAITGGVTKTTPEGTTLEGTVDPNGLTTTAFFEFGFDQTYGSTVTVQMPNSLTGGHKLTASLAGLYADTLYHYRIVAANASGTSYGVDKTFGTAGAPVVVTGGVSKMAINAITMSGTVNPSGLATTCCFEYGQLGSAELQSTRVALGSGTADRAVNAAMAHLKPNQSYFYCLVATNSAGTVTGGTQTFATGSAAPSVPTITVSGTGETVAAVDASLDTGDGSTNLWFQYGLTKTYGKTTEITALEASGSASTASVDLFALAPHTTYHVRCVAQNAEGTAYSSGTTFTTRPRFDMNSNGYSDLLLSDTVTGETVLLFGNGTVTSGTLMMTGSEAGPVISTTANLVFCGEAEFNQNGTVAWVLSGSLPAQTVFLVSGTDGWTSNSLETGTFAAPIGTTVAGVADFNGDGNPDLLLVGANRKLTFWLLDGFTVTAQKAGPTLPVGYVVAALDDLNGNGKPDILIWNPTTGKTETLNMNEMAVASTMPGPPIPISTGWQLMGANVYTGTTPEWLLYNPTTQATQIWTVKGTKESSITGPDIQPGISLLGTM